MRKVPGTFRQQVHAIGMKVAAADGPALGRVTAADQLERWVFKNANPLAHAIVREWVIKKLNDWLSARARELAGAREHEPAEQTLLDFFGEVPLRIEIGVGRFADLVDVNRVQLHAWKRQAHVKRDNVVGYVEWVDKVVDWLEPKLTDDAMTVREALAQAVPISP